MLTGGYICASASISRLDSLFPNHLEVVDIPDKGVYLSSEDLSLTIW
jgi:hypothetical protein